MHGSALMHMFLRTCVLAACLLACDAAQAAAARCHIIYGGEEWTVEAAPTADPYKVEGRKIGRYFEFKLVYAELPTTGAFIRAYTYGMSSGDPVLIHQATWRPPFDARTDDYGFSGFQYVYEPSKSSELQYWCEHLR
jgi:hypothetical protein